MFIKDLGFGEILFTPGINENTLQKLEYQIVLTQNI